LKKKARPTPFPCQIRRGKKKKRKRGTAPRLVPWKRISYVVVFRTQTENAGGKEKGEMVSPVSQNGGGKKKGEGGGKLTVANVPRKGFSCPPLPRERSQKKENVPPRWADENGEKERGTSPDLPRVQKRVLTRLFPPWRCSKKENGGIDPGKRGGQTTGKTIPL